MDIDELGRKQIEQLVVQDLVCYFADLYRLDISTLQKMKEMVDKASANEEEPSNSGIGDFEGETGNTLFAKDSKKQPIRWAENILAGIGANKTPRLARPLFAPGIRHVGERTAKALAQAFDMFEHVRHVPESILACLPNVGTVAAHSIIHFLVREAQQAMIDELLAVGVVPRGRAITIPPLRHAES